VCPKFLRGGAAGGLGVECLAVIDWQEGTMDREPPDAQWEPEIMAMLTGLREWRAAHPHATFAEIEAAVDDRLDELRARMVEEAAQASRAASLREVPEAERPRCPDCGQTLVERNRARRTLTVRGNRPIHLERSYGVCPACGAGLFPPG
jgi:RNase P subunit RPR2